MIRRDPGHTVLQGAESGEAGLRGWSVLLAEDSGLLSATVVGDGVGFIIFGACTLPEAGHPVSRQPSPAPGS